MREWVIRVTGTVVVAAHCKADALETIKDAASEAGLVVEEVTVQNLEVV